MSNSIMTSMAFAAVGVLIGVIILKVCNNDGKFKSKYDERQKINIGKSYKFAMITAWVLMAIYVVIDMGGNKLPMENSFVVFSIMFVSMMVYTSSALWTDAYFGSNNNYKRYALMAVVVTIINGASAVGYIKDGQMFVDGVLTYRFISVECASIFLIFGIECLIKSIVDKKKRNEEDDEDEES